MKEDLKYTLMVIGMVVSWSIYYAVSKIVVDATGSARMAGFLLRTAALVFLTIQLPNLGYAGGSLSTGTALLKTDVLMVNLATVILYHKKLYISDWLGTAIMLGGVLLVLGVDFGGMTLHVTDLYFLLSAACVSANAFIIKAAQEKYHEDADMISYYNNAVVLILFGCSAALHGEFRIPQNMGSGFWWLVVLGGLAQTGIYFFYYRNLKHFEVWLVKLYLLLMPVLSCFIGVFFLNEDLTVKKLLGILVVLALMSVKRSNRSAALRILHEKGAMSRKRLAENMHLTPAAITKIVGEMISDGLLMEGEMLSSSNAGRREILIDLNAEVACGLGILINLRQAILSGVWLDGRVIFTEEVPLETKAPAEATAERLSARLLQLTEENGISRESVIGLGVAVRGITSEDGRIVRNSFGALAETDYPLCEKFEELTGFHTVMENNVRSLFAAQMFVSQDETTGSQLFIRCGYGIGAALSIDGKIWHGVTAQCAEIGHIPVIRRGGKPCHCGKSGCLETIASPGSIREDAIAILSEEKTPLLWRKYRDRDTESLSVFDVFAAASNGDQGASEIVDRAIQALGTAIKAAIYLVDPGKIVLYGSLFEDTYYLSRLISELQEGVDARHDVVIEKSKFNQQLEDRAACLLAVQNFIDNGGIR